MNTKNFSRLLATFLLTLTVVSVMAATGRKQQYFPDGPVARSPNGHWIYLFKYGEDKQLKTTKLVRRECLCRQS